MTSTVYNPSIRATYEDGKIVEFTHGSSRPGGEANIFALFSAILDGARVELICLVDNAPTVIATIHRPVAS